MAFNEFKQFCYHFQNLKTSVMQFRVEQKESACQKSKFSESLFDSICFVRGGSKIDSRGKSEATELQLTNNKETEPNRSLHA